MSPSLNRTEYVELSYTLMTRTGSVCSCGFGDESLGDAADEEAETFASLSVRIKST